MKRRLANALLLAAGYYIGAQVGLLLRLPPATPSVLWPPNPILTAALLLAPIERWGFYLLAVLPAHLLVQLPAGFPLPLALALFVTNCSEALIAASLVRWWSDDPTRFDTLRRISAFVGGAVLLAPFLSSFLDAGVVSWLRGETFWPVWRMRTLSNMLGAATLVPSIVILAARGRARLQALTPPRLFEAAALATSILLIAATVSAEPSEWRGQIPALALLLPLIIFAAVRFGPGGVSFSVLGSAVLLLGIGIQARGPFAHLPAGDSVVALQITLLVITVPLLVLTALFEERRMSTRALEERLRFEKLVSSIAAAFVQRPIDQIGTAFEWSLARLGAFLGAPILVARPRPDAEGFSWTGPGPSPPSSAGLPQTAEDLRRSVASGASAPVSLPDGRHGFVVPLMAGDNVLGALALLAPSQAAPWNEDAPARVRLIADVFAGALARRDAEEAVRRAETLAQRSREELAHFLRVSTVGEMTTSLAHELNQPLTAILANAQAARRLLKETPETSELREILADIADEGKRAGEVIRRLRELLRKGDPERRSLDLNTLVQESAQLVAGDARLRGVDLTLDLSPDSLTVTADRIQVQQVLLNLLLNAMEAIPSEGAHERKVVVRTSGAKGTAEVSVRDTGSGMPPGAGDAIFNAFFTTKPGGMGMGLAIARSIVESHRGTLSGRDNPDRGATFTFVLPIEAEAPEVP